MALLFLHFLWRRTSDALSIHLQLHVDPGWSTAFALILIIALNQHFKICLPIIYIYLSLTFLKILKCNFMRQMKNWAFHFALVDLLIVLFCQVGHHYCLYYWQVRVESNSFLDTVVWYLCFVVFEAVQRLHSQGSTCLIDCRICFEGEWFRGLCILFKIHAVIDLFKFS